MKIDTVFIQNLRSRFWENGKKTYKHEETKSQGRHDSVCGEYDIMGGNTKFERGNLDDKIMRLIIFIWFFKSIFNFLNTLVKKLLSIEYRNKFFCSNCPVEKINLNLFRFIIRMVEHTRTGSAQRLEKGLQIIMVKINKILYDKKGYFNKEVYFKF